ncbi:MAG TPA: hypothetical protein VF145_10515 [Chitinophagaceae bacterium]
MSKPVTFRNHGPRSNNKLQQVDRIAFLADKYGVSRKTVLLAIAIAGGDDFLTENILSQNRFSR